MKILMMEQRSHEWHQARCASIGGTAFSKATSGKKNRLVYDLANEKLNGFVTPDDYVDEDTQFGVENEPIARDEYCEVTGIMFREVGLIKSDYSDMHHASPDGLSPDNSIVLEIKCTQNGAIHMQRYFEGVESSHMPQIINYFAVSDDVKEVHWVSFCPFREERPLVPYIFKAEHYQDKIAEARTKIKAIELEVDDKIMKFSF